MIKNFLLISYFFTFNLGIIDQVYSAPCIDDPRLPEALIELSKGADKITPPLTITPETWLNMHQEFRSLLAGNAKICPGIPILKTGKALQKVELDFATLWVSLRNAAMQNDREKVKWIFDTFKAKPIPVSEIIKTIETPGMTDKGKALLCEIAGITNEKHTMVIDFFAALGGKPVDKTSVLSGKALRADVFSDYPCQNYRDWVTMAELGRWGGGRNLGHIFEKLRSLGIDVQ